jgi:hypothetical protein
MVNYMHPVRTILALLIVALTVSVGTGASGLAQAAPDKADKLLKQISKENRKAILKRNDYKLKAREPLYVQHAASLAEQYRETAEIVARQGGDAQALLAAAAYFEGDSELISRVGPKDSYLPNDHASVKHKHGADK